MGSFGLGWSQRLFGGILARMRNYLIRVIILLLEFKPLVEITIMKDLEPTSYIKLLQKSRD